MRLPFPKLGTILWFVASFSFLFFLCSPLVVLGQPYYVYQKTFYELAGLQDQVGYELQQTNDNGYAIGGFYSNGFFYLLKTDNLGSLQWTAPLRGEFCYGRSMQQTSDNGYVMAGYKGNVNLSSIQVMKYFSTGANDWRIDFEVVNRQNNTPNEVNVANCIRQTSDNGYILTGYTKANSLSRADLVLAKLNNIGGISWAKIWQDFGREECYDVEHLMGQSVEQTSDGGYIIAGTEIEHFKSSPSCIGDIPPGENWATGVVIKTDMSGNELWKRKIYGQNSPGSRLSSGFSSVQETSDGGYIVVGYTTQYIIAPGVPYSEHKSVLVVKLLSNGQTAWAKVYDTEYDEEGYSVKQTSDGGYIIAGMNYAPDYNEDAMLIKINAVGQITWAKAYGWAFTWSFQEYAYSVVETFDALGTSIGYAFTGYQRDMTVPNKKVFLVQTSPSGNATLPGASNCSVRDIPFITINTVKNIADPLGAREVQTVEGIGGINAAPQTVEEVNCDATVNEKRAAGEDRLGYSNDGHDLQVAAYPNPVTGESVGIRYELEQDADIRIVMLDVLGRTVYNYNVHRSHGLHEESIDVRRWSKGVYTLVIYNGEKIVQRKMIQLQ